jgi:hypothetical protein
MPSKKAHWILGAFALAVTLFGLVAIFGGGAFADGDTTGGTSSGLMYQKLGF